MISWDFLRPDVKLRLHEQSIKAVKKMTVKLYAIVKLWFKNYS